GRRGTIVLERPPFETTAQHLIDLQDQRLGEAVAGLPGLGAPVRTVIGAVVQAYLPGRPFVTKPIQLLSRTDALDHVQRLASGGAGRSSRLVSEAWRSSPRRGRGPISRGTA